MCVCECVCECVWGGCVEGMVHISPFRRNPLFHGYCGLLQLTLWRRERASEGVCVCARECVFVSV